MKPNAIVSAANVKFGNALPLSLIAGPCQMESRDHAFMMAGRLKEICGRLGIGLVYKSSFDKANRTSLTGKRGMGLDKSLAVFADIRKEL
ncbi:MAG: 3-deoxy-8-phosphooctulonate synthase, partial [Alphaproteobacteria bacterium]|nr:3-deoxy-8-phosphooctulonate synthase [Alphaproteobacteria bacterium]